MRRLCGFPALLVLIWTLIWMLAWTLVSPAVAADRIPVGRVIRQEGSAAVLRDALRSPLLPGTAVFAGDVIETAAASRVTLRFDDDSTLTAGPESRVAVSQYAVSPEGNRIGALFSLLAGIVRTAVQQAGLGSFAIQTEAAVASARSTEWTVEILPTSTAVLGLAGTVEVTARATGASVTLTSGQGTDVAPGGGLTPPVTWRAPRVERTLSLVGPAVR
jgi:ferric-dicitrate binding protein FerR (iron transport regulator)